MLSAIIAGAMLAGSSGVDVKTVNGHTELSLQGTLFHSTNLKVSNLRTLDLAGSAIVALWNEGGKDLYAVSLDGTSVQRLTDAKNTLDFQYHSFDPKQSTPNLPARLKSPGNSQLFVVQFETQSLEPYRRAIRDSGGTIVSYIPNNAYVVKMDRETREAVQGMNFVRYVGSYDPAYRIDPKVSERLLTNTLGTARYSILLTDRSPNNKDMAAGLIRGIGGTVHEYGPGGQLIEATLTPDQLVTVAGMDAILWMDPWGPMEKDMDIARIFHGTNNLETLTGGNPAGYSGEGVIGMDRDTELRTTHQEFQVHPPIMLAGSFSSAHGTSTYGIIFASGVNPAARGVIPDAQGVFRPGLTTGATRYNETVQAINNNHVVFETNSTGSPQVTTYTSVSADIDDLIFDLNILLCQSQSNTGSMNSRPQAWAKNIVSVGGISHFNTVSPNDDRWTSASFGPASDGRIKPDLASFYDLIFTTTNSSNTAYTQFGGTSGATPITCGHFGLVFQMWSQGVFNNTAYGTDVFSSKCNAITAKAIMINRAKQWVFPGGLNVQRRQQGWGHSQVDDIWLYRDKGLIVDQSDVLEELDATTYRLWVPAGETSFNATMAYRDLPGNPSVQSQHRVNDLTLKVTDPGGNVYWGNNGLSAGMTSVAGGAANTKDTVENVLVPNPTSGVWIVEVSAPEINGDTHPETVGVDDADYALVVTGVAGAMSLPTDNEALEVGNPNGGTIADTHLSENNKFKVKPGVVLSNSQAPVRMIKEVVAPTTPGDLWIVTEASASSNNVDERVELWNWNTNSWNLVATHTDMTNVDKARSVFVGSPANYVNGSNHIKTRVSYILTAPSLSFPWQADVDHIRVAFAP